MGKNQHVVPRPDGKWGVRGEGNSRDTAQTNTQREAQEIARRIAVNQESEVITHGKDGKFRQRNSYGNDPYPPKG